jgi:hypothetical protein
MVPADRWDRRFLRGLDRVKCNQTAMIEAFTSA